MIGLELSGGLGNQMFRYAFARAYWEKRGKKEDLVLNFFKVNRHGADGDLENFQIMDFQKECCPRLLYKIGTTTQKLYFRIYGIQKRLARFTRLASEHDVYHKWVPRLRKHGIVLVSGGNADYEIDREHERIIINGNFENSKYFKDIIPVLKKEFVPKHGPLAENDHLYKVINETNSVCVNVRRGDYLKGVNKDNYFVCDLDYYKKAIELIREKVENPTFIFFSNDIQWVKDNIKLEEDCYYESGNDPVWETFRLMYSCKHFIISNSTFHWWAQFMGNHPGKITIAPSRWYNNPDWESYLIEPSFLTIEK